MRGSEFFCAGFHVKTTGYSYKANSSQDPGSCRVEAQRDGTTSTQPAHVRIA